jgi:hypothetical protein
LEAAATAVTAGEEAAAATAGEEDEAAECDSWTVCTWHAVAVQIMRQIVCRYPPPHPPHDTLSVDSRR